METASAWIVLDKVGNDVFKQRITPAEAQVLNKEHQTNAGKVSVTKIVLSGKPSVLSAKQEVARLRRHYSGKLIDSMFPGENPTVPLTFESAGFDTTTEDVVNAKAKESEAKQESVKAELDKKPKEDLQVLAEDIGLVIDAEDTEDELVTAIIKAGWTGDTVTKQ